MFYGQTNGVQLSYGITQGAYWTTIATHLREKMAKNGWKQVFDDSYLHNLLFYTQVYSMGQQMVFNYSMVSFKVSTTLMTPNSCPMGHHSHSFA
jgi:hypothetical protein